ncbi:MAG: acetate--CoA ligase family protein, partial [Actinomycetota bacterium]|nr:acetate--CoA ligase family protein [Actinomycetota bacterium]MED6330006.1 acetate--CoA ligase family protein [Actinomycetota bacterium]
MTENGIDSPTRRGTRTLSEARSRQIVADAGIPVSAWATVGDPDAAVDVARSVGLPAVIKLCGDAIAHKTERGLVRLSLTSEDEVRKAATELLAAA